MPLLYDLSYLRLLRCPLAIPPDLHQCISKQTEDWWEAMQSFVEAQILMTSQREPPVDGAEQAPPSALHTCTWTTGSSGVARSPQASIPDDEGMLDYGG